MPSRPPTPGPSPLAVVHSPQALGSPGVAIDPMRLSRPDPKEGSIPAYGADDTNQSLRAMKKKGGAGTLIAVCALVVAAIGGIAFFAVQKPTAGQDPSGTPATDAPSVTSGTPTSMLVPPSPTNTMATTVTTSTVAPTSIPPGMIAIGDDLSTVPAKDAGAPVRSTAAHTSNGGAGHGVRNSTGTRPSSGNDQASSGASDPKPSSTLAPDPFGTPE